MENRIPSGAYLLRRNPLLREGIIAAPLIMCVTALRSALMLCYVFCAVTVMTCLLSVILPRRIPLTFRILSYSVIGALVYIPAYLSAEYLFPESVNAYYLPLVSAALILSAERDSFFTRDSLRLYVPRLLMMLSGVCLGILLFGLLRGFLGAGVLWSVKLITPPLPFLTEPAAGLILFACICIAAECLCGTPQKEETADASDS